MAAVRRTCKKSTCHNQFTPRRGTRRVFCYECRPERSADGAASMVTVPPGDPDRTDGEMQQAVRAELERLEAAGSVAGTVALRLARSLDDPNLGAAQVSSISAQLIRTLEPLQRKAKREPDRMDARVEAALKLVRGA